MKLLKIDSLAIDSVSNDMVILLTAEETGRILPIWIGNNEAIAIALTMADIKPPRPMTHDLIVDILVGLDVKIQQVVLTALVDNTYYALIYLQFGNEIVVVDSRPSDSIALAVRVGAPIFIRDEIPTVSADENDPDRQRLESRLRRVNAEQILGG